MPELPDILLYIHALRPRIVGQRVLRVRLATPFLLRSVDPPLSAVEGKTIVGLERIGKRIVMAAASDPAANAGEIFLVFHLMIAGRFRWKSPGLPAVARSAKAGKVGLLALDFPNGTLILTEAGSKRQASLYVVGSREALAQHDPGGVEIMDIDLPTFAAALTRENHTLKHALTDPHLFSGIGNAYSDEILHAARLSPFKQTASLSDEETRRLYETTRLTLSKWAERLRQETGDEFPEKVTAFREGMAVHGRFGKPCPDCGAPVQRIVYAANEANYCANCQTGGRLLADRSLSRLLRDDWPRTLEELEHRKAGGAGRAGKAGRAGRAGR